MEDPMVLLNNLNSTQERYNSLQGLFNEFCAQILNLKKEDDRLDILTVEQSGNTLSIEFLDRKIEAKFQFFVDENGSKKGCIHCQLLSSEKNDEPIPIEKFSFNGQGIADIPFNNDREPYVINERSDAVTIVLNWATISIKENH